MATSRMTAKGRITIPKALRERLGLLPGDEVEFIDLLNSTEAVGAKIYGVDASTDIGLRVSSLGGIVGLLRFAIR